MEFKQVTLNLKAVIKILRKLMSLSQTYLIIVIISSTNKMTSELS